MKAVRLGAGGALSVSDVPEPTPGEGEVRLRVAACGICGSDLHFRHMGLLPDGYVLGHEFAGVVDSVGVGVTGCSVGDAACVYPFVPSTVHDMASAASGIGCGGPYGGLAEYAVAGADRLWRLPASLPVAHGALVEPLAVALHALDIADVSQRDTSCVVGAGPIGVLTALALKSRGVECVVVERDDARRKWVSGLGFEAYGLDGVHESVLAALGGAPSVVFECAGHPSAPGLALELVAPSGVVVLLGMHSEPVPVSQLLLMLKEAQLRASFCYRPASFDEAVRLLAEGVVPVEQVVTSVRPLSDAPAVLDELGAGGSDDVKVLLVP